MALALAVKVRESPTCWAAPAALDRLSSADYNPARVSTPIIRFGLALNDYRDQDGRSDAARY
ncbi:hypothetical protein [Streptomyces sp. NPDC002054]|uniref:hypothetical protein n=1 Tax=Streptomyces sp. NPDC002054 TaxID=3154663 RepID=UPI00332D0634